MEKLTIDQIMRMILLVFIALALYGVYEQRQIDSKKYEKVMSTDEKDSEKLRTIYMFDEGILITSSVIEIICIGDNDKIANAMLENTIQRKAEVEEHIRKSKAICKEILKDTEVSK